ncbi:anthranilate synthase component II [Marinoscillum furvescens]|uniref:Anthranilate synthase component II n=1 Tax=Marinoscillum furvescens DSM 4134 TaxID=1122208 RepID=A0A3D9L494_MARFU|nr:aminodeoxychorismate/anthranilate synthase component II [Marinoscillum furvescens]RED97457.1 anthranilate synthase component II [Marinoscillum furvescens DSM 4134]
MKKVLVIDNYDSFTYNLVHILRELGLDEEMEVHRNDKISVDYAGEFERILLSPGPGLPKDAGIMPEVIKRYADSKSILGVCLGHQGIAESFGAELFNLPTVFHGVATGVDLTDLKDLLFEGLPDHFSVCRYHSWAVKPENIPNELQVTAVDAEGNIMALRHESLKVRGVQFHPESIMTEHGKQMMKNWISEKL